MIIETLIQDEHGEVFTQMNNNSYPIPLSKAQELLAKQWAADDRLWTTQKTVEFNLRVFARAVLGAKPDIEIPPENPFKLTRTLVNNCRTERGGFTNATLKAFGLKKPLKRGWGRTLHGVEITQEAYCAALAGRYLYKTEL